MQPMIQLPTSRQVSAVTADPPVAITGEIQTLLNLNAVVAIGVSGGKDSQACAIAVARHLDAIGHKGPRVLVHADLGRVEWQDSLPVCERLAEHLGWDLMTVHREAGDMMDRWQGLWKNNLARYADLSCVKLILPWSTPSMRFCTSELKVDTITRALKKRYPNDHIVNVAGIRREESATRSKMPVSGAQAKLMRRGLLGYTWNAIIDWKKTEVLASIDRAGLALHEAYTRYNASRVSCVYCIMSTNADLLAGTSCADNQDVYREMVALEAQSTFAFQGGKWLADVAPHLLTGELRAAVSRAKEAAIARQDAEARLPKHLLYTSGWPAVMPTAGEAELIASVRRDVASALDLSIGYTTAESVMERYADLLEEKRQKDAAKAKKGAASAKCTVAADEADIEEEEETDETMGMA